MAIPFSRKDSTTNQLTAWLLASPCWGNLDLFFIHISSLSVSDFNKEGPEMLQPASLSISLC